MIFLLLFLSSDYTVPVHMEVSITDVHQYKAYTHDSASYRETHTHTFSLANQGKPSLMAIATILTCAGGSQCEQLTSSASIHQAVEVFPGSAICVVHQFYHTFRLHLQKETTQDKIRKKRHTYLMLSVWVLYSMMVLGGRLRTLRRVSLMRAVVAWSLAVLFQMEMMSSWRYEATSDCNVLKWTGPLSGYLPGSVLIPRHHRSPLQPWTAPQALPRSGSPSTGMLGPSSNGWSTFHPSYWHHPEQNGV